MEIKVNDILIVRDSNDPTILLVINEMGQKSNGPRDSFQIFHQNENPADYFVTRKPADCEASNKKENPKLTVDEVKTENEYDDPAFRKFMESLEKERLEFNCELYQSVVAKHKELFKDVKPEETTGSQDDSLCILDDIEEIDIKPPRVPRHRFRQNQNLIEMESASTSKLKIPSLMDSSLATKPTRDQDMVTVQCIYLQPLNDYFKVKGMRDFAGKEGELSFSEGEILFIADASRPLWWQAENRFEERGLVPSQFVQHVPANVQVIQAQPSADGKKLPPGCKKPSLTQLDKIWFHLSQGLCTPMMRYQTILDEKPASAKHYQAKIFRSVLGVRILVTAQLSRKARRNESESMPIILDEEFPREVAAVIAATDLWAADQKVTKLSQIEARENLSNVCSELRKCNRHHQLKYAGEPQCPPDMNLRLDPRQAKTNTFWVEPGKKFI